MASRYVPPALRNKTNEVINPPEGKAQYGSQSIPAPRPLDTQHDLVSLEDIRAHFWPVDTDEVLHAPPPLKGTLNASAADVSKLAYVVLFKDANPRWESDGIIFTKSNLDLIQPQTDYSGATALSREGRDEDKATTRITIPTTQDPSTPTEDPRANATSRFPSNLDSECHSKYARDLGPIAIFAQGHGPQAGRSFQFIGWYKIVQFSLLDPRSPDLVRMLEQKWSRQDTRTGAVKQKERDASKWEESLGYKWAVMKTEKDAVANKERGKLVVKRLPLRITEDSLKQDGSRKTVNEMLAEMRVGLG